MTQPNFDSMFAAVSAAMDAPQSGSHPMDDMVSRTKIAMDAYEKAGRLSPQRPDGIPTIVWSSAMNCVSDMRLTADIDAYDHLILVEGIANLLVAHRQSITSKFVKPIMALDSALERREHGDVAAWKCIERIKAVLADYQGELK